MRLRILLAALVAGIGMLCANVVAAGERELGTSVVIQDIEPGDGAEAHPGQTVSVHYTGWLTDGTVFDTSRNRVRPMVFRLGAGEVIKGWDQGIVGMRIGGVRRLTVPPELAYGDRGVPGVIPPKATLVFEVKLYGIN